MKLISIVTPCYNEEGNILELIKRIRAVFENQNQYSYEHIIIDNDSKDNTKNILLEAVKKDKNIKLIFNAGNYGHIRSPHHALLQASGDAVVVMVSDLQDPPELISDFILKWENGTEIVLGIKNKSKENPFMFGIRKFYYHLLNSFSENDLISNFTGFGLYDRKVVEAIKQYHDPYPYFRGLISELGFKKDFVYYTQQKRIHGKTKNNFFTLFDMAMLGFVNYSKLPIRIATISGFILSGLSFFIAIFYFIYKLLNWDSFQLGVAPIIIGLFFFSSLQLLFIGIIGEYVGAVYTQTKNRPLVIERERINFDKTDKEII